MSWRPWHRERHVDPEAAQRTMENAIRLVAVRRAQAQTWERHLESNGFAEMVESLFMEGKQKGSNDT